ncbi:MAG TPA: hypothetical protein DIT13_14925 [Verrucomicrobiales bacterium]|nr:hypothetical protein [Verrucomicrobiales bacterium]HRJ09677.1 sulfocyanin-like copper-binding protein [Prosthecobacter sp.]HRK16034.1 sulfocyanin-like copper-binding protein [Prosthecobacter sp.]
MRQLLPILPFLAAAALHSQTPPPAGHEHGGVTIPGLKHELFEGVREEDLLRPGNDPKSLRVTLVATFNAANYGMNFNGWSHGKAVLSVPLGWRVDVTFINPSPIPHSAIVIEKADTKKLQVAEPWFEGGATPKHLTGQTVSKAEFSFTPDEEGEYALACGFPAHAVAGHWVALNVIAADGQPALQLGDKEPVVVK